jgi:hypothetical protein
MADAIYIIYIVQTVVFPVTLLLTLIYLLPIILIQRFHTTNNILTGNFCLAGIVCCVYWEMYYLVSIFNPVILFQNTVLCICNGYLAAMVNCLVVYSLTMITINRCFTIIYPQKRLFKKQAWSFISMVVQWMVSCVLSTPSLVFAVEVKTA